MGALAKACVFISSCRKRTSILFATFALPKNKNTNPYIELAKLVLPAEVNDYFEWTKVETEQLPDGSEMLHIYLQEDKERLHRLDTGPGRYPLLG